MAAQDPITWLNGGPAHTDAVVIPCDGMAFPFALFLARQIETMEPGRRFDVAVAVDDRTAIPAGLHAGGLRLLELSRDPRIAALPRTFTISQASYYWIALTAALHGVWRRVLFLDADMWLRRPGLSALFRAPPLSHAIAAAPNGSEFRRRDGAPTRYHRREGLPASHCYRNSGVELIDIDRAVAEDIPRRLIDLRAAVRERITSNDQLALNSLLREDIALLSPVWNFQTFPGNEALHDRFDPVLLHFTNHPKPWVRVPGFPDQPQFAAYDAFLRANFGAAELRRRGLWGAWPALGSPLNPVARLRHLWERRRQAYLNREKRRDFERIEPYDPEIIARLIAAAEV